MLLPSDRSMSSKPSVSIVVLGYNNRSYLEECFVSILAQKGPSFEVLYVDNASTDGSSEFVRSRFPLVRVVQNSTNSGYAGGNNFGVKSACGEYLLIVNPDTVAQTGWLAAMFDFVKKEKEGGRETIACSKVLLASQPDTINTIGLFMSVLGFSGSLGDGEKAVDYLKFMRVFAPTGCSFLISHDCFLSLRGFDESFFMYDEDVDLGWRATNRGVLTWMVPTSTIWHKYKSFFNRVAPYFQTARNRMWMIRKNESGAYRAYLIITCTIFSFALSLGMLMRLKPSITCAILHGLWDGLYTPIKSDECAGGSARELLLGLGPSLNVFAAKFVKHIRPKKTRIIEKN